MRPTGGEGGAFATRVAFVFSGGASYAAAQAGMLRAVTAAGIVSDLVVGTSAGALNAVAFAADPTSEGVEHLVRSWMATRRSDVFPLQPVTLAFGILGHRDHLVTRLAWSTGWPAIFPCDHWRRRRLRCVWSLPTAGRASRLPSIAGWRYRP